MRKLRTVKEVCEETGLTRKLLFDYKEIGMVQPSDYANYKVDDTGGYKLYDQEAFVKLKQIAIYRELGMERKEIKQIISSPDYDSNQVLEKQLVLLKEKKERIDQLIAAVEQLRLIGIKERAMEFIKSGSLAESTQTRRKLESSSYYNAWLKTLDKEWPYNLEEELSHLATKFIKLTDEECESAKAEELLSTIAKLIHRQCGIMTYIFGMGIAVAFLGEGLLSQQLQAEDLRLTTAQSTAMLAYIRKTFDGYLDSAIEIIENHALAIGKPFDSPETIALVNDIKVLNQECFGMKEALEYGIVFDVMIVEPYGEDSDPLCYVLNAVKYHSLKEYIR